MEEGRIGRSLPRAKEENLEAKRAPGEDSRDFEYEKRLGQNKGPSVPRESGAAVGEPPHCHSSKSPAKVKARKSKRKTQPPPPSANAQ